MCKFPAIKLYRRCCTLQGCKMKRVRVLSVRVSVRVCVCVHACVRAHVRACVCAYVCVLSTLLHVCLVLSVALL